MTLEVRTHNDTDININGTCLWGYVSVSSQELVDRFGPPIVGDPTDKVEFEWNLEVNGHVVTIYSWKTYGRKSFKNMRSWHVGGHEGNVVDLLVELGLKAYDASDPLGGLKLLFV